MQRIHTKPLKKSYYCPKCRKMLKFDENTFNVHYEKCGVKKTSHQKHLPSASEEANWFECSICGYRSLYEVALKKHMTMKHVGILPGHKCDACGRTYSSPSALSEHKRKNHQLLTTSVIPNNLMAQER